MAREEARVRQDAAVRLQAQARGKQGRRKATTWAAEKERRENAQADALVAAEAAAAAEQAAAERAAERAAKPAPQRTRSRKAGLVSEATRDYGSRKGVLSLSQSQLKSLQERIPTRATTPPTSPTREENFYAPYRCPSLITETHYFVQNSDQNFEQNSTTGG